MNPVAGPLVIIHRRNGIETLSGLPPGAWIEIDIDLLNGEPVLSHDPVLSTLPAPSRLIDFLPQALRRGVAGFILDCKREGAEYAIEPLLAEHNLVNYFYINEMEVQGDMCLAREPMHKTAVRIWQYRGARDLIRYAEDMKKATQNGPCWAWIDGWQRGLLKDMDKVLIPITQIDARALQKLDVKLCLCSPELYVHDYRKKYKAAELEEMYRGVVNYRKKLLHVGIQVDAVCTKFPWLWTMDIELLLKAKTLSGM